MKTRDDTQTQRFYGRPADRTLQGYKDFIRGMTLALNPEAKDDTTEEQWRQAWQEFWSGAGQGSGFPQE
jgi:hypothetical protein